MGGSPPPTPLLRCAVPRRLLREKRDMEDYCEDVEREMFEKDSLISDQRTEREETQKEVKRMRSEASILGHGCVPDLVSTVSPCVAVAGILAR